MKGALRQGVGQVAQPSACEGLLECHSNTINSTDAPSEAGALRMVWIQACSGQGAQMEIEGGSKGGFGIRSLTHGGDDKVVEHEVLELTRREHA